MTVKKDTLMDIISGLPLEDDMEFDALRIYDSSTSSVAVEVTVRSTNCTSEKRLYAFDFSGNEVFG